MQKLLFKGPVLTASGYGEHARQLLRAVLSSKKYDVFVEPIKWGDTPHLRDDTDEIKNIYSLASKKNVFRGEYDLSIQVTIPPEFAKLAKVNIGVTAGIEVDRVSPLWLIKANENVDFVITPSNHSALTYADAKYKNNEGHTLEFQKKMIVCPEGVDTSVFNNEPINCEWDFPTSFNFISTGLGFDKQNIGDDRKNLTTLVKWFCERFKDDKDVGLILKCSVINNSILDKTYLKNRIEVIKHQLGVGEFPRIYLVHGRLKPVQMAALYKHPKVKAYVTLTHGEGFGLPIIEAAACDLPVMATNWSGHLDFLKINNENKFIPIDYELKDVPQSAVWDGVIEEGTKWAYPKEEDFKLKARKLMLSYDKPKQWAVELGEYIRNTYSLEKTEQKFLQALQLIEQNVTANVSPNVNSVNFTDTVRQKLNIGNDEKTLLFTMPCSAGDVFCSTGVVSSLKHKYPDYNIYFATEEKYWSILKGNKDVYKVINFENWMGNVSLCEDIFDLVFTPNLAIQLVTSNWVKKGTGRKLADEIAYQCGVDLGDYSVYLEEVSDLPEEYIVLNPGSGKGQWEARNYTGWQDIINNVSRRLNMKIVQVGLGDDPLYDGTIDFRGKTKNYNQLAYVVKKAKLVLGIDTCTMHFAAALGTPSVSLFGSSYAKSTGPSCIKAGTICLEPQCRRTCKKACYKYQCSVDRDYPCINDINPRMIVDACAEVLGEDDNGFVYEEFYPKIAGYTHVLNAESQGFPYEQSIRSMLGFCDTVVVVEGGSTDGTKETLDKLKEEHGERLNVIEHQWDWDEPAMDGMQKAFGRAMCDVGPNDFLWQQDADEVVHEKDYAKIKKFVKRFPKDTDLVSLPVVELWGDKETVRTDRHSWKWRLSRNNFRITHGINKHAKVFDESTGKTFARKNMSDGCEYIDIMTGDMIPHKNFYDTRLDFLRQKNVEEYADNMNRIFDELPSVYHYSWCDLERKVRNFKDFWDKCWSNLYNEQNPVKRFPDVNTNEDITNKANELKKQGGEHFSAPTFKLNNAGPQNMLRWPKK
jgi:ADP-heptose:LPS heptosyltransferase/glycosyltransferase involved in cell wall biosynthesis